MIDFSDVTIIIPHLGADDQQEFSLEHCVYSLHETVPDIRILVVTNGRQCKMHGVGNIDLQDQQFGLKHFWNVGADMKVVLQK